MSNYTQEFRVQCEKRESKSSSQLLFLYVDNWEWVRKRTRSAESENKVEAFDDSGKMFSYFCDFCNLFLVKGESKYVMRWVL